MDIAEDALLSPENRLLARLHKREYKELIPHLEPVSLEIKEVLHEPGAPIEYVYFPWNSVLAVVAVMQDGSSTEVLTVGKEGMVGLGTLLGSETNPFKFMVLVPGKALRLKKEIFREVIRRNEASMQLAQRYFNVLIIQLAQSVACNSLHFLPRRCCRWILTVHDQAGVNPFPLTQEFSSEMLAARRASITVISGELQEKGLIRYKRGLVTVIDRKGLEAEACECYRMSKKVYEDLIG